MRKCTHFAVTERFQLPSPDPCRTFSTGFEGASATAADGGGRDDHSSDMVHEDPDSTDGGVAEFSSSLGQKQRSHIIRRARAGAVRVIVCSDGMARGMDLDGVGLVVNYDVPSQPKTYVHRWVWAVCNGDNTSPSLPCYVPPPLEYDECIIARCTFPVQDLRAQVGGCGE